MGAKLFVCLFVCCKAAKVGIGEEHEVQAGRHKRRHKQPLLKSQLLADGLPSKSTGDLVSTAPLRLRQPPWSQPMLHHHIALPSALKHQRQPLTTHPYTTQHTHLLLRMERVLCSTCSRHVSFMAALPASTSLSLVSQWSLLLQCKLQGSKPCLRLVWGRVLAIECKRQKGDRIRSVPIDKQKHHAHCVGPIQQSRYLSRRVTTSARRPKTGRLTEMQERSRAWGGVVSGVVGSRGEGEMTEDALQ